MMVSTVPGVTDFSLDTDTRCIEATGREGVGNVKCWPSPPWGVCLSADQGVVGVVSGWEVTITWGEEGVELLQLLELESKGAV